MKFIQINIQYSWLINSIMLLPFLGIMLSCTSFVPDDLDSLGDDIVITTKEFSPYMGRVTTFENTFNVSSKSTLPLNFKVMGMRTADGVPAPELLENYPVKVWTALYTGQERSLAEINKKRKIEYRPLLEIQAKSGDLTFWNAGSSSLINTLPMEGYLFDIEVENTGGRRYFRNLALNPKKERDYEPSQYDDLLGIAKNSYLRVPLAINLFGERTDMPISDIRMYIFENKEITAETSSLRFSVLDSLGNAIDIRKFKETDFENLIHGFNHRFENGKVIYDVAYPIPLITYPTRYTNYSGSVARANLKFNRIWKGGFRIEAYLLFDFAIFREGHWEIQIRFNGESPNFENEQ